MSDDNYPIGVFKSRLTGQEPFLADHIINGNKILPGVAYLEISRAAVASSVQDDQEKRVILRESVFMQALICSEPCTVEVMVYPGAPGEFGVEVRTQAGVHFQSKAYLEAWEPAPKMDVQEIQMRCPGKGPTDHQFYENFKQKGIELGASHRGIKEISLGENQALISAYLPGSSALGMVLNPGMFDSFIQSGDVLADDQKRVRIPFAVMETQIYGSLTDKMYGHIVKKEKGVDITIADVDGNVKVKITDFMGREIDTGEDEVVFYKPEWEETAPEKQEAISRQDVSVFYAENSYSDLVFSLFDRAKHLVENKVEGHAFEVHLPSDKKAWLGILGMLKTISLEYPKISYQLFLNQQPVKLKFTKVQLSESPEFNWANSKTLLITGALGGIGKIIVEDIVKHSHDNQLILLGRSPLSGDGASYLRGLALNGNRIDYFQCDVSNKLEVSEIIDKFPRLNGVIHCAGVSRDNFISKKTKTEMKDVLASKIMGFDHLDEATSQMKLDFFVTMSSVASVLGNAGQTDYAAANGYLDSRMYHRASLVEKKQRYGKSISINWPLWENGGMQIDEEMKKTLLRVLKIKPMPASQGLVSLKKILSSSSPQLMVLFGNKQALHGMIEKANSQSQQAPKKQGETGGGVQHKEILEAVRRLTAEHLKRNPDDLSETADWADFGFDSILLSSFANKVNAEFGLAIMPSVFFEATNIRLLGEYLIENHPEVLNKKNSEPKVRPQSVDVSNRDKENSNSGSFIQGFKTVYNQNLGYREKDVAVIGMSCKIAGAENLEEFWEMLINEKDMISEIPKDRWNWEDYPGVSKWGSFIEGVADFDSLFFGISPVEAFYMVPEQRLLMEYVWKCLEHAGYGGEASKGNNTGLFVGCGPSGYTYVMQGVPVEAYSNTGYCPSVGPNRISYLMDWHGPSNPIDTACSSTLVAIHRAVEAIHGGHCDQAIAGGVNLLLTPDIFIGFSKAGMLCDDGRCKTFSADANGYVRGEGIGLLLLKPLKKALEDGDFIHAVIKGTAENHGGHTNSLTAPNPKSQAAVIKKAFSEAGIDFSRVSYVECHGTGTGLGDPVEIQGLKKVAHELNKNGTGNQICKLGSIKSNIGHLEYAAGAVGIIKVILQMKHRTVAKSLHCDKINPYIDLTGTPFQIAQSASEWSVPLGQSRVAGVSSFGFGGVNAHIVLEEFQQAQKNNSSRPKTLEGSHVLVVSARDKERLQDYVKDILNYIEGLPVDSETLSRIAYTLQVGRAEMSERLAFITNSVEEWSSQLKHYLKNREPDKTIGVYTGRKSSSHSHTVLIDGSPVHSEKVEQLLQKKESEKIAELWVQGTEIKWDLLYS